MGLAFAPASWISPRARLALMVVLLTACAQDHRETAVAIVGTREITAEELRHFVRRLAPSLLSDEKGQRAREEYLQTLIDREIALLAACEKGLDQAPDLLKILDEKRRAHLLSLYRDKEILPRIQVSEEEIRQFSNQQDMARERRATAILVRTWEQAQRLRAQLEAGSDFGALARKHSLDTWSALREGELGFVTRAAAEQLLGIPAEVFDTLGTGRVSPPLRRGRNYHLVRFLEDRSTDPQTQREDIRTQLRKEKQQALEEEQAGVLAGEFNWQLVPRGATLLRDRGSTLGERGTLKLTHEEKRVPLFTYEGGAISLADYMAMLRQHRIRAPRALLDSVFIGLLGRRFLQKPALFVAAAERLGLPEDPEAVKWVEKTRRELLVRGIRQREVIDPIAVDEADVQRFYEENDEMFRLPEQICFDELLVASRREAEALKTEIAAGTDLVVLAGERGLRVRQRNADNLLCLRSIHRADYAELWQALQTAPRGELRGPIYIPEGYILFKVIQRQPPQRESFDLARRRAEVALRKALEKERFDAWIADLRQRYEDRVQVFPDRLAKALPQALLDSLSKN